LPISQETQLGAGEMSHYFTKTHETLKSNPLEIAFRVHNEDFVLWSDDGVFSKNSLDRGTAVLLDLYQPDKHIKKALDLGCGYGTIGIVMHELYKISFDMVDVNDRAIELSKKNNAKYQTKNRTFYSDGFEQVQDTYDLIVSNPPIRIGKGAMYQLFTDAKKHLKDKGVLVIVINKKHGALSAKKHLDSVYKDVETLGKQKGFYVFLCKK